MTTTAVACLCLGVKAGVQKTVTQSTATITTPVTTTTTTTTSTTEPATTKPVEPYPSVCNAEQSTNCGSNCLCRIGYNNYLAVCGGANYQCPAGGCQADAECASRYAVDDDDEWYCVRRLSTDSCSGVGICMQQGTCPNPQDFPSERGGRRRLGRRGPVSGRASKAKRELENVFARTFKWLA